MGQLFHTLTVESQDEVLPRIMRDFGGEAQLVTTKQIRAKGINQKPLFEVVVAISEQDYEAHLKAMKIKKMQATSTGTPTKTAAKIASKTLKRPSVRTQQKTTSNQLKNNIQAKANALKARFGIKDKSYDELSFADEFAKESEQFIKEDEVMLDISNQAKEASPAKLSTVQAGISELKSKIAKEANIDEMALINSQKYDQKIDNLEKLISELGEKMSLLVEMTWEDKSAFRKDLIIPPEFAKIYKQAKESGMKEEHLEAIMKATIENMPTNMKANKEAVTRYFNSLLRNMLPTRKDLGFSKQKIMMLVGPTGVGKTTTLAKLAYRYAWGESDKNYKTGIITLDTYRIGAVEQLYQYAKMMKLPILDSIEPNDLDAKIKQLSTCDIILVDTTGNSQYDQAKLAKIKEFLQSSKAKIDVNLIISANTKLEDLEEIYKSFAFLNIDTIIITKFDETKVFGNIFSLLYETKTPTSFFSLGQEVPDDIMEASSDFLVSCVLKGYKRKEDE